MSNDSEMIARIDERTGAILERLDKLNDSQDKQWKAINENAGNIKVLDTKVSIFAGAQIVISTALATVAAWLGVRK